VHLGWWDYVHLGLRWSSTDDEPL